MADKRLIPNGIHDISTEAFNELIDRLGTLDLTPLLVYIIDDVDASALPHLAEQFHVAGLEGWELAETEEEKRTLIKKAIELHRYKGTLWAVKHVFKTLNIQADIVEWFENGKEPYTFNVKLMFEKDVKYLKQLFDLIDAYKNVRSHYNIDVDFIRRVQFKTKAGACLSVVLDASTEITKSCDLQFKSSACMSIEDIEDAESFKITKECQLQYKSNACMSMEVNEMFKITGDTDFFISPSCVFTIEAIGG